MKTVQKTIDVPACDICGKEIEKSTLPEHAKINGEDMVYHVKCGKDLLVQALKELKR